MPSSQFSQQPVIAVGTAIGIKIFLPCRLFKRYEGTSFGGEYGLYVSTDEHIEEIDGTCIALEAGGNLEQTRILLNNLLPQSKVNDMLTHCWLNSGEKICIKVLARVVSRARNHLRKAADESLKPMADVA